MNDELLASIRLQVAEHDVKAVQLWFTDILGELEMVEIHDGEFAAVLERGLLEGETLGLHDNAGADIVDVPHWSTFRIAPRPKGHEKTAHVFCTLSSLGFVAYKELSPAHVAPTKGRAERTEVAPLTMQLPQEERELAV
jgi:glutamine synthetase